MNEVLKCIKSRRSVRKYAKRQIEDEKLKQILEAGTYAPSGNGKQSGKIIVLQHEKDIEELEKLNARVMGKESHPFYGAPTVCVVLADANIATCVEDGSVIIENMMLAAHSLGIGSCFIYRARESFEYEEGKELLRRWGIAGNYVGVGQCILGYAEEDNLTPKDRKTDYIVYPSGSCI